MPQGTGRWLRRWSGGFVASVLLFGAGVETAGVHASHVLIPGTTGLIVQSAIDGATRRLKRPACAALLDEFQASDGLPLAVRLSGLSLTPSEYLGTLWFADADNLTPCHQVAAPIAFTTPGHTVVYVCGHHFMSMYDRNPSYAEILVIHEMLHAAGLGENPPSSEHISRVARARCV